MATRIEVSAHVSAPPETAWIVYTEPAHICAWNAASPDWHTPRATTDLRVGGRFTSRMEARDGSMGFDFEGTWTRVDPHTALSYTMPNGREADITFTETEDGTTVLVSFDAEETHPLDMQKAGWQAILDNYARHAGAFAKNA